VSEGEALYNCPFEDGTVDQEKAKDATMYKCILLPTDGTEFCERAIRHGIGLAKLLHAKVVGVTVTQPLHSAMPRSLIPKNLAGIIHAETVKLADERLAVIEGVAREAGVHVETVRQSNDHPWEAIVHTAQNKHCDLIVMASHGRRGVSALVLGSETQKVLTHSKVPVLVVR
jgi:nucleotide-binding universal stress UspA family protein